MSRKKSGANQPKSNADRATTPPTAGQTLPNRPKSTGLLRVGDTTPEIDEIDEIDDEFDEIDTEFDEIDEIDTDVDIDVDTDLATDETGTGQSNNATTATKSGASSSTSRDQTRAPRRTVRPQRSGTPASATAVVAKGVAKTYGDLPALAPLDLTVATGERVALIGHNGSGKTTFLKMVCGLLEPSEGEITIFGDEPGSMGARRAVSYLSDQPVFYEDLSLIEHIEYVARLHGVDDWQAAGDDLLERFRLGERRDDLPVTFSRGLKQKASICLAFIRPFDLLVVDEPFVGLDALGRTELLNLMTEHHERGATLLVATHELTTVGASDRIVALRSGEVAYDGDTEVDVAALVDDAPEVGR